MLSELKNKRLIWIANETLTDNTYVKTGFASFDNYYQGLPSHGLIELQSKYGSGEIQFLLAYLRKKQEQGIVAIVQPPGIPCAELLQQENIKLEQIILITPREPKEALWAVEQCLQSGVCSNVLFWHNSINFIQARRINLACEKEQTSLLLFRDFYNSSIPACKLSLRLELEAKGLRIKVKKYRGRSAEIDPLISFDSLYSSHSPDVDHKSWTKSASFGG